MLNIIEIILSSGIWPSVFVLTLMAGYIARISRKKELKSLNLFRALGIILAITSLSALLLPLFYKLPAVAPTSLYGALQNMRYWDPAPFYILPLLLLYSLMSLIYLLFLSKFTKKRSWGFIFILVNMLALLACVFDGVYDFLPNWSRRLYVLPNLFNIFYVSYHYYQVSKYNTERSGLVLKIRPEFIRINLLLLFLMVVFGPDNTSFLAIYLPVSFLVHFWVLYQVEQRLWLSLKKQQNIQKRNIKSLISFMKTIGTAISEKVEVEKVMDFVVSSALEATRADGAVILLVDEFEDELKVKSVKGEFPPPYNVNNNVKAKASNLATFFASTPIPIGETVLGEAAATGKIIFIPNTKNDPRMVHNVKDDLLHISSLIAVPLILNNKVLGVLAVVSRRYDFQFTKDHYAQMENFGDYTSMTINNLLLTVQLLEKQEMEREVGIAAEIQGQLLPHRLPQVSSISMAAYSLPAKGVSGDYYDVINVKKGNIMMVMCDVAGKGVPASLVMVMIRTIIHLVSHQKNMTVSKIMEIVNWGIAGKVALDRFATMSLLSYDFYTQILDYSNAAHHPLLIYRAAKDVFEEMDTEGIPIGLEKKTKYNQIATKLEKDDIILLYTDGIIEAMNDKSEQYSLEALQSVLREVKNLQPEKIKSRIIEDISRFVGKARQHDDQTFLIMKITN
ncbi:MAG: hypothetical protein A2Z96_04205 [Spirochaetes bacterium GWB1_48_6]|nr:MAG: hypothetical protein A2Z96_04205 [Spirochaetes bacterium GWB1_48_6]